MLLQMNRQQKETTKRLKKGKQYNILSRIVCGMTENCDNVPGNIVTGTPWEGYAPSAVMGMM